MKKAKETQAAAGKSNGMSGRDLVRRLRSTALALVVTSPQNSSPSTPSGSKTKTTTRTTGTLPNIANRKRRKIWLRKKSGYASLLWAKATRHHLRARQLMEETDPDVYRHFCKYREDFGSYVLLPNASISTRLGFVALLFTLAGMEFALHYTSTYTLRIHPDNVHDFRLLTSSSI